MLAPPPVLLIEHLRTNHHMDQLSTTEKNGVRGSIQSRHGQSEHQTLKLTLISWTIRHCFKTDEDCQMDPTGCQHLE